MNEPAFGDFSLEDRGETPPPVVVVTHYISHMKSHGQIWYYSGHGHVCPVFECEINQNPKDMKPIFNSMDRDEFEGGKPIEGVKIRA